MPQPFDSLQERLLRAGIAPRHVRRYCRELEDHFSDLIALQKERGYDEADATIRARALLGDDEELTDAMLATARFRSLTARAPWLVLGVLPPLVIVGGLIVLGIGMAVAAPQHGPHLPLPAWCAPLAATICSTANYAVGPLAILFVLATAWRQRLYGRWPVLGVLAAMLFGAITTLSVVIPEGSHKGEVSVGVGMGLPALLQSTRFVVIAVLAVASLLLWQRRSAR